MIGNKPTPDSPAIRLLSWCCAHHELFVWSALIIVLTILGTRECLRACYWLVRHASLGR